MFIYCITNTKNGKFYIGQTTKKNVNDRWSAHKTELKKNRCNNPHLQRAWNKYGEAVWKYKVIDSTKTQKQLNELENFYINLYESRNIEKGYNIREGGSRGIHSSSTRNKISKIRNYFWKTTAGKKLKVHLSILAKQQKHSLEENIKRRDTLVRYKWITNKLKSPSGKIHKIYTIKGFCRKYHLLKSSSHISRMLRGVSKQHKGWTLA